jgi:serine/threonine protein kinase
MKGDLETYWKKTGGQNLSAEFKDLIIKMFAYDGAERPSVDDIKNHPWMQKPFDHKEIRNQILSEVAKKRSEMTNASSRDDTVSRGDSMLDLVKQTSVINNKRFNDMSDFDISVEPGVIWDDLNTFNTDHFDEQFTIEKKDGMHILMTLKAKETGTQDLQVKVKFFQLPESEDEKKIRIRFVRKTGEIDKWYSIFNDMREAVLHDIL